MRKHLLWILVVAGCGSVEGKKPDAAVVVQDDAEVDAPPACPIGVTAMCPTSELITCDGQGNITAMQPCVLGCNTGENRCLKVAPSNNLSALFDEAEGATDFVLSGSTIIDTDSGSITDQSGARTPLTSTIASSPIGMFVVKVKSFQTGGGVTVQGTKALVILSAGDVKIDHDISVSARLAVNGPGAIANNAACRGGDGAAGNSNGKPGGGGGGFGTAGGKGGNGGSPVIQGGDIGMVAGNPELVPLRGGCPGGRASGASTNYAAGAAGGALQIVSGTSITIASNAALLANGTGGRKTASGAFACLVDTPCGNGEGGGAGGGILLEAPVVTLDASGGIFANGGGGSCSVNGSAQNGQRSTSVASGETCTGDTGSGGNGAAGATAAQNGANGLNDDPVGGGGGGGMGRIRVNLPLGTSFSPAGSVSGVLSAGTLQTR